MFNFLKYYYHKHDIETFEEMVNKLEINDNDEVMHFNSDKFLTLALLSTITTACSNLTRPPLPMFLRYKIKEGQ